MSRRHLTAAFLHEGDLLGAVRDLRSSNLPIDDVFTPYAVHGLDDAVGLRPTRIGWVCAILGLSGAAFAYLFQEWTSAVSWKLNVGGKPFDSWPAFVPVIFEVGVLCGGIGSVLAMFYKLGLYPGKNAELPTDRVTDDQFVVVLDASGADFRMQEAKDLLRRHNGFDIEETIKTSAPAKASKGRAA